MGAMSGPGADASRPRRAGVAAALTLAAACAVPLGLNALGRSTRAFVRSPAAGPELVVVANGREALSAWRARGLRGRALVHAGRFLHFVEETQGATRGAVLRPGAGDALTQRLVSGAGPTDYLWVAASAGVARRIAYVAPPTALAERLAALGQPAEALPIPLPSRDFPRELHGALPGFDEPVLVEVSASWFDDPRAPDLSAALRAGRPRCDLVVVNLATDAADVSDGARAAARELAAAIGADRR